MKNKSVLFLCDRYGVPNDANSICVKNVVCEFQHRGFKVFCIYNSERKNNRFIEDGISFIGLRFSLYDYMKSICKKNRVVLKAFFYFFSLFRRMFVFFLYPNVSPLRSLKYTKTAKELIEKEKIGTVIAVYRPFESFFSLFKLKKEFKDEIFCIAYHLDVLTSPNTKNKWIRKYQQNRGRNVFAKECNEFNMIVLPSVFEGQNLQCRKIQYANFPVCNVFDNEKRFDLPYELDKFNFVYVGTLNSTNRNPEYTIKLIESLSEKLEKRILFHVWGNIDVGVMKKIQSSNLVKYHGLLEPDSVMYALKKSDAIVNVSNELTPQMVPSKIFQYFSTRKPILNVISSEDDCSIAYFEKYGMSVNLHKKEKFEDNVELARKFFENIDASNSRIDESFLLKCTPAFFVDLVETKYNENNF